MLHWRTRWIPVLTCTIWSDSSDSFCQMCWIAYLEVWLINHTCHCVFLSYSGRRCANIWADYQHRQMSCVKLNVRGRVVCCFTKTNVFKLHIKLFSWQKLLIWRYSTQFDGRNLQQNKPRWTPGCRLKQAIKLILNPKLKQILLPVCVADHRIAQQQQQLLFWLNVVYFPPHSRGSMTEPNRFNIRKRLWGGFNGINNFYSPAPATC